MVQVSYRRVTGQLQECYRYISVLNISVPNIIVLNIPYYRVNIEKISMLHLFFLIKNITQTVGVLSLRFRGGIGSSSLGAFFTDRVAEVAKTLYRQFYKYFKMNKIVVYLTY